MKQVRAVPSTYRWPTSADPADVVQDFRQRDVAHVGCRSGDVRRAGRRRGRGDAVGVTFQVGTSLTGNSRHPRCWSSHPRCERECVATVNIALVSGTQRGRRRDDRSGELTGLCGAASERASGVRCDRSALDVVAGREVGADERGRQRRRPYLSYCGGRSPGDRSHSLM